MVQQQLISMRSAGMVAHVVVILLAPPLPFTWRQSAISTGSVFNSNGLNTILIKNGPNLIKMCKVPYISSTFPRLPLSQVDLGFLRLIWPNQPEEPWDNKISKTSITHNNI